VEEGGVNGESAPLVFHACFIVPQRFVIIAAGEGTKNGEILGRANRFVERVVGPTEPEALGRLNVDTEVPVGLPGCDQPGTETVGLGFLSDDVLGRIVSIVAREYAAPEQAALFLEVIIAGASGQLELAEVITSLAKQCLLLDVVWQVRVVWAVRIVKCAAGRNADRGRIT